ncbi:MAG: hypothetical protein Q6352_003110 [Candidatus Freyrarchaeum guaymaensis]|nr:hypothetical protein [Candidatus Sigynarchaeota archaeon]
MGSIAGPLVDGVLGDINFGVPFLAVGFVALAASVYMLVRLRLPEREGAEVSIPYRGMLRGVLKIRNVLIVVFIYIMVAIFFGFIEPLMPPYLLGDSACPEPRLDCFSA